MFSPLEQFDVVLVAPIFLFGFDISILNLHWSLLSLIFFVLFLLYFFLNEFNLIPNFWQFAIENLYFLVLGLIKQQVGAKGYIYFPFIFTLFNFILILNLLSLTPFSMAFTSHIISIFFFSFTLILSVFLIGFINHGVKFLKIFIPECPFVLLFWLIPIEIFSYFIRAFSLALRLSANIMAGHTLVHIICGFLLNLGTLRFSLAIAFGVLLFLILGLELGVAFLQAYVFTILFCIYLADSIKSPAH